MNYNNQIKEELINIEVYKKVNDYGKNRSDLDTYYKDSRSSRQREDNYGIIREYSMKLIRYINKIKVLLAQKLRKRELKTKILKKD